MKILGIIGLACALAGCAGTSSIVQTEKLTIADVPDSLWNCPTVQKLPSTASLTEAEVAKLVVILYKNNVTCKNSETAIRKYLAQAKVALQKK